jgi:Cys-rich protein (TIGR01571 family)
VAEAPEGVHGSQSQQQQQQQDVSQSESGRWEFVLRPMGRDKLSNVGVFAILLLLFAFLYDSIRFTTTYVQPKGNLDDPEAFRYGLFDCSQDSKLSFVSLLCLPLRWADTMDKANDGTLIKYWPGVVVFVLLGALNIYLWPAASAYLGSPSDGGRFVADPIIRALVGVALLGFLVTYRQKLRKRYEIIPIGDESLMGSWAEDAMTWLFCPCCAAVQEARQVEANYVPMERHY